MKIVIYVDWITVVWYYFDSIENPNYFWNTLFGKKQSDKGKIYGNEIHILIKNV